MRARFVDIEGARSIGGGVAVVVDVMRAYTVAAWALHRGAAEIVLVDDVEEAVHLASERDGSLLFKDGEHDDLFDLHNSPRQLLDLDVAGRPIVQRTGAGTRAAVAAAGADRLFCTGFVCASATASMLHAEGPDLVTFVVSGGLDAEEDLACAEFIAVAIGGNTPEPGPYRDRAALSSNATKLALGVELGYSGIDPQDVPMCLEVDRFDFAMPVRRRSGRLVLSLDNT